MVGNTGAMVTKLLHHLQLDKLVKEKLVIRISRYLTLQYISN